MKNHLSILFVFLLLLLPFNCGKAVNSVPYTFQQINTQDGLSLSVQCLAVSHEKGYVWIGTRSGVGRFDGYELKKYLPGNVTHIVEDKENTVWVITGKGLFSYNYQTDEFKQACDAQHKPVMATSLCLWEDGVYFGSNGRLYKYTYGSSQIEHVASLNIEKGYNMTILEKWDNQTLICANRWNHALLFDVSTKQIRKLPFESNELTSVFPDREGNIWIAPYHQGVKCYNKSGELLHSYNTQNSALKTNVVLSLTERNGYIWIATDGGGIYILNPDTQTMSILSHTPGDPYSLPDNSILSLYTDSYGEVWAGSIRSGLFRVKEVGMRIYTDAMPGIAYGMSNKTVLSIYQDEDKSIWIGTDGGGINRFDPEKRKFEHILPTWGNKIASIAGAYDNNLLVSLFSKGVFFFDKQKHTYKPLVIVNDSINELLCQRGKTVNLFKNTPETVLLLSDSLYRYHLRNKTFTPIYVQAPSQNIFGNLLPICQTDSASYLYDFKRIYRLGIEKNCLEAIYSCRGDTLINSVSADENQTFWIGSNYGLGCFVPENGHVTPVPNKLINEVNSLICDETGRIWIGTEGKLFAYLIQQREFVLYGESDGIIQNEYLAKPRLLSARGDIYMGGFNGLLCINSQLPYESPHLPELELTDVWVGGERLNAAALKSLKVEEQSKPISIKIMARNKDIFRKPMYRYTLHGMDGQVMYSYQPELTLNGLPAGKYQIAAACSTRTGGWSKDYNVLELTVLPPWYKSGWFILCSILLAIITLSLTIFSILRRKDNKLKLIMKEHERQVYEEKVRFLMNINHELRTPLTLIHAPLKQLLQTLSPNDNAHQVIQSISKQSRRMKKLLDMVLDVRKMETGQSILRLEVVEVSLWIEQLIDDFRPEAATKGIQITHSPDETIHTLCFDKEKCTSVLSNLLVNALKYTPEQHRINVFSGYSSDKSCVRISISDQGPGLKDVDKDNLFTRFYQGANSRPGTGIGLSYSKILVEQHGGNIGAYEHEGKPGATFWFELPIDVQPGRVTVPPQTYLNELLAPVQTVECVAPQNVPSEAETTTNTLLIVEDNKDLIDYLHSSLKMKFKEIFVAYDGREALQLCREVAPDIIVSDIQMPHMDGYTLCRNIKEDLEISHIPVILLTARNDEDSRTLGYKNGADAYLTKPFEINTLYALMQSLLRNRKRMLSRYKTKGPLPLPEESTFSAVDEEFLKNINALIIAHLDSQELGVPFLCSALGLSSASLYNKLKTLTGMGANNYITKIRLEQAIELLTHSSLKINEIADRTGFSTSRYFSTAFKQYMGCSPTVYKQSHGNN